MLREYEATLCANYSAKNLNSEQYRVFESVQNEALIQAVTSLPTRMKNPFKIMLRWLKFEILDLEAIIEAISQKNEMERRKQNRIAQQQQEIAEMNAIKEGQSSLKLWFMSKNDKINKITELTSSIQAAGTEIECLGLLHKIVVLQLNQAAIQFFKRDKFLTYNHTVNLYLQKQMENTRVKMDLFTQIGRQNKLNKDSGRSARGKDYEELLAEIQP